jgi:hypothetical protein
MVPNDVPTKFTVAKDGIFQASNGTLTWSDPMSAAAHGRLTWGGESLLMAAAAVLTGAFSRDGSGASVGAGLALVVGLSELYAGFAILAWSQASTGALATGCPASWLRPVIAIVAIAVLHCIFRALLADPMYPPYRTVEFPVTVALIALTSRGILLSRDAAARTPRFADRLQIMGFCQPNDRIKDSQT